MSENIKLGNLEVQISTINEETKYIFKGDVDEHFRQEKLPRHVNKRVIFDLGDLHNFNSCGIREWIYLIRDFTGASEVIFRNCSVTVIDQINMVPDSQGAATIESFYAPYFCERDSCKGEMVKLVVIDQHASTLTSKLAPAFDCETCMKPLEFDALEESYFIFLEKQHKNTKATSKEEDKVS